MNEGRQAGEGGWPRCWPGPTLRLAMHTSGSTSRHIHSLWHPLNRPRAHPWKLESWKGKPQPVWAEPGAILHCHVL